MPDLSAGEEIAGYRIEEIAGRGGMGVVYRATDLALDRQVALKLIAPEFAQDAAFRERFKRESRLAASIRHPNVITVFRAGEEDGRLYIAMDYIQGTDLRALIASRGRLEPQLASRLISQVAAALDAAHAKTLVHRDVKPANVLVAEESGSQHAFLTDFGLTKDISSETGMTKTGVVVGTIDYMAPEQVAGDKLDARSDIYSLGCVLWETLTGQVPYPRASPVAKMYAHANEPPPSLTAVAPDTPPQFEAVVMRAMAKKPEERYLSAGDLGRAAIAAAEGREIELAERSVAVGAAAPEDDSDVGITAVRKGRPGVPATEAAATAPSARAPRRGRRRWLALGAAAVTAVIVAAAVLISSDGGDGKQGLSRDEYQDQVLDAARPWSTELARLTTDLPARVTAARDVERAGTALASLRETTDSFIATLEDMTPAGDIEDIHARLIQIVKRIRGHIADAGAAAQFGDNRVYRAIPERLDKEFEAFNALGPEYAARGYTRLNLGNPQQR